MINRKRHYFRIFLHVFVPILCGTTIYALWRGLHFFDQTEKKFPLLTAKHIPNWIKFNLPDGLWFYAFLSALLFIWIENVSGHFGLWLVIVTILSFFSEVLQLYNILPGTFDWQDLLAYSLAILFFFFNFKHTKNIYL